ncbi:MAG: hypothetical protein HY000_12410 [Planctomycetes bacterium]|nr:hypothetical protein [Planctomycetota bacterium]
MTAFPSVELPVEPAGHSRKILRQLQGHLHQRAPGTAVKVRVIAFGRQQGKDVCFVREPDGRPGVVVAGDMPTRCSIGSEVPVFILKESPDAVEYTWNRTAPPAPPRGGGRRGGRR